MKRRNADCGKIRRPIKRNKIAEGMYGSTTILYMKFLILWAIVITADFMFMFRFEFLWPFWLLLRSVHDSFKYKGLAFSVLFVCIAITSDLVCLFFIPVHWLLFAASTYVWVQYVWHTDKGICLPTIILWMLFVYLEAGIRWKDSRHMPHLDLCRPFAAHCIGYPVVTLGFGFKSYVGYRMRQRKQREVAKENEFYMQLLQQALPQDETLDDIQNLSASASVVVSTASSGTVSSAQTVQTNSVTFDHSSHGDEKNHLPLIGNLISSQTTQTAAAAIQSNNNHHQQQQHHHHHNLNNSNSGSSNRNAQTNSKLNNISNSTTATANGHVTNTLNGLTSNNTTSKSQRRSVDKEKNDSSQTNSLTSSSSNSNNNRSTSNSVTTNSSSGDGFTTSNNFNGSSKLSNNAYLNQLPNHLQKDIKDKDNWDSCASSTSSSSSSNNSVNSAKDSKQYSNSYEMTNGNHSVAVEKKNQPNGNVVHYDIEEVVAEPIEKVKGRRNRSKKDSAISSKDNHSNYNGLASQQHHHHHHLNNNNSSNHHNHHNSHQQQSQLHKDSTTSLDSTSTSSSSLSSTTSSTISNVASQIVTKICETCLRLEAEIKKYRTEISHMKQIENEMRQKMESNAVNKSCLQAKQRENDEMEKRLQELTNARQVDLMNLQNAERRLGEERRQRQSLDSLLNNEKKARKIAEEKATRPECSEQCKQRKLQIEAENKQLRRELKANEDAKLIAEQQGRKCEQELRMFEQEVRNREAQQGTEVLMSALAAMQDKNSTLEKNLSAETRVKLDLFSALGEAKRQLEIKDSMIRNKDDEVLDLKAKIAQLLAVMPTDSLCLPQCSTTGSSMLRMNDTPPLQGQSSPMMSLNGPTHQQMMVAAHQQQQLNSRNGVVGSNIVTVVTSASGVTSVVTTPGNGVGNNALTQTSSNLDPNATAYTPKNSSLVGGAEA